MISDAIVIGVVLGLVFAAVAYYLYSRSTQLERKVGLMENILLDLKVTTEQALLSITDAPDGVVASESQHQKVTFAQKVVEEHLETTESSSEVEAESRQLTVESPRSGNKHSSSQQVIVEREDTPLTQSYEEMTYKQLMALAKERGVSGTRNVSKSTLIDLIRRHEEGGQPMASLSLEENTQQEQTEELSSAMESTDGMGTLLEVESSLVE